MSNQKTCAFLHPDGRRCTGLATRGDYCWWHAPDAEAERAEARAKGGRNRAYAARAERLLPSVLRTSIGVALQAMRDVQAGKLEASRGQAIASLASAITRMYLAGLQYEKVDDLESLLKEMLDSPDAGHVAEGGEDHGIVG